MQILDITHLSNIYFRQEWYLIFRCLTTCMILRLTVIQNSIQDKSSDKIFLIWLVNCNSRETLLTSMREFNLDFIISKLIVRNVLQLHVTLVHLISFVYPNDLYNSILCLTCLTLWCSDLVPNALLTHSRDSPNRYFILKSYYPHFYLNFTQNINAKETVAVMQLCSMAPLPYCTSHWVH